MLLSTSWPSWIKIVFVVWIVFTLVVVFLLSHYRERRTTAPKRTPLYENTKQRTDDFYANLDKEQLSPWIFFNTGKMPEVKKYYGGTIKYSGASQFSGSPVLVFWGGFIEPFLEHGIVEILQRVADDALANQVDPAPCIREAAGLLDGVITRTYNRMAEIDQRLRGKGDPQSATRKDVSQKIESMLNYLKRHTASFSSMAATRYEYFLRVESRQDWSLRISAFAIGVSIISLLIALLKK